MFNDESNESRFCVSKWTVPTVAKKRQLTKRANGE